MHPHPLLVAAYRIAQVQDPCPDPVAEHFPLHQPNPDSDSRRVCELAAGHVLAVAAKGGTRALLLRAVLPPGWLLPQGMEAARLLFLCRVQMVKPTGLRVQKALP